ncbi:HlyD family efflux transporter periplasmic adaptor subunit [Gemmatimonas sp.]|uniref:HlyD family secretion protein n=1 Tax=Gemmatimonas sp. TaxID=1962908 RepID=UPI00286E570E|nr:HlyD family efflux transporter periplasmic adaptor subunit [Gemmatimonas sp.]
MLLVTVVVAAGVSQARVKSAVHVAARVQPQQRTLLRATQTGRVVAVHVATGTVVRKGDSLLLLGSDDSRAAELQLDREIGERQSAIALAEGNARNSQEQRHLRVEQARARLLSVLATVREKGVIFGRITENDTTLGGYSPGDHVEMDRAFADERLARLELASALASLADSVSLQRTVENSRMALAHARVARARAGVAAAELLLRAPHAGRIATVHPAELLGTMVRPGDALLELHSGSLWRGEAQIPESEIARIHVGDSVRAEAAVGGSTDRREYHGKIAFVSDFPTAPSDSRATVTPMYRVEFLVGEASDTAGGSRLRVGSTLKAAILVGKSSVLQRMMKVMGWGPR